MRQRNIKNLQERIDSNSSHLVREPKAMKGRWHELFGNDRPIFLEVGSGKGQFILKRAETQTDANFIACEGQDNICLRVLEKAEEAGLPNLKVFMEYIHDIHEYFEEGELEGIYLNFSDPWPKERHAKRRLTHRRNLTGFMDVLIPGGAIEFKTDNDSLFEFSLEEIRDLGYEILEMTRDLHNDPADYQSKAFPTEYEERFSGRGKNTNYVKFRSPAVKPEGQEENI
jgi:tRNA (guanine-N7-)-methyltransferase